MQLSLWNDIKKPYTRINDAAKLMNVSVATIHNWLKEGYLEATSQGYIYKDSIEKFINCYLGKGKLNSRANKLQKDYHDHKELSKQIIEDINSIDFNDSSWQNYEFSLSESYRNKEGIYYTPSFIIEDMLSSINDFDGKTFLEPSCGSGNFIIKAIEKGIDPKNIYAFDTDSNAVEITKKRIKQKTGIDCENIICGNFLDICKNFDKKFDYIFTNPPWGKKLLKDIKNHYAHIYKAGNSNDTCSLFFFACMTVLKENGTLGFLLPEAFFNISTFEDARIMIQNKRIERIIDYGKPFKGLITKAQAIILKNEDPNDGQNVLCEFGNKKFIRNQISFKFIPKHIYNFWVEEETAKVIEFLYSLSHITLKDNTTWGLGIVTGNNAEFCKSEYEDGFVPIYRGQDITNKGLKEPTLYISEDLSRCQQVAPLELYKAKEKLIYRFISSNLVFYCDKKKRLILNSANMLILNDDFPITGKQLSDLLNSDIMNWLFKNIFNTHKVLRSDLELMPLHIEYFKNNPTFDETSFLKFLNIEKHNGTYSIKR